MTTFAEVLKTTAERAAINADFFESYANLCLAELRSGVPLRLDGMAFDSAESSVLHQDAASAFREASQWAILVDPLRAARSMRLAADEFLAIGNLYGLHLQRVTGVPAPEDMPAQRRLDMLHGALGMAPPPADMPGSLRHTQQQTYLLLELASWPEPPLEQAVARICVTSEHRTGGTPVGALGAPVRNFWLMAHGMAHGDTNVFFDHYVAAFRDRHREAVDAARSNRYLWENGATGVDVVDPDALNIAALAVRRFGASVIELELTRRAEFASEAELGVLFRLGVELAVVTPAEKE